MKANEIRTIEREATKELNRRLRKVAGAMPYALLRRAYNHRLANAETRKLVRAEAKRRGYRMDRFGG